MVDHWAVAVLLSHVLANQDAAPSPSAVCCLSAFCSWCVSYHLRKRVLRGDMTRYICCMGDYPCSGRCGEQSAPECCLCLEVGRASSCFPAPPSAGDAWMLPLLVCDDTSNGSQPHSALTLSACRSPSALPSPWHPRAGPSRTRCTCRTPSVTTVSP